MKTNFNPQRVTIHGNHPDLSWYDNCRRAYYAYRYERNMLNECIITMKRRRKVHRLQCDLLYYKITVSPNYNWTLFNAWETAVFNWEKAGDTLNKYKHEFATLKPRTEPSWSPPLITRGPRIRKRPARGATRRAAIREYLDAEPTADEIRDWDNAIWYLRQLLAEYEEDRKHYARKATLYKAASMEEQAWECYSILFGLKLKREQVQAKLDRLLLVGP